jgi:hypothetical protein
MPELSPAWMNMLTTLATVAVAYGGIRADLKNMMARLTSVEHGIEAARVRMDNHIERSKA